MLVYEVVYRAVMPMSRRVLVRATTEEEAIVVADRVKMTPSEIHNSEGIIDAYSSRRPFDAQLEDVTLEMVTPIHSEDLDMVDGTYMRHNNDARRYQDAGSVSLEHLVAE